MKTLIGLVVVLIAVLGIIWYARRDESFLSNIFKRNEQKDAEQAKEIINGSDGTESEDASDDGTGFTASQDSTLLFCTPELLAQDCSSVSKGRSLLPLTCARPVIPGFISSTNL